MKKLVVIALPLLLLLVVVNSCKKNNPAPPEDPVQKSIGNMTGRYIGKAQVISVIDSGQMYPIHRDTSVYPDTVMVTALSSDSFKVTSVSWHSYFEFKYDSSNDYFVDEHGHIFGVDFFPVNDSLIMGDRSFDTHGTSNERGYTFTGKKQ